jgi:hypothetical protein
MRPRLSDGNLVAIRAIAAGGFVGAFLFALILSAAPHLHEIVHQPSGTTHQCVVTLLTAGSCDHAPCDAIAVAPRPPKPASTLFRRHFHFVSTPLEFSLLEHAPPTIS